MKLLNLSVLSVVAVLVGCNDSDLADLHRAAIDEARAAQLDRDTFENPYKVVDTEYFVEVDLINDQSISVQDAQQIAHDNEPELQNTNPVVEEIIEPVIIPEVVIPEVVHTVEEVLEVVNTIDPDGETIFTYQDTSNNTWTRPGKTWVDSYSVGNRCFIYSGLDHGIKDVIVDTPYGPRTIGMVNQLIGPGPGIGDNPRYNDIQCGNGPANDYGDEDAGQCPGRIDQGASGCGTIGPKWYFEQ